MSTSSKWLLGLIVAWLLIGSVCVIAEGRPIDQEELDKVNIIASPDASLSSIGWIFTNITSLTTWNFSFFQSGIGVYIRMFLWCLSAAIVVPLAIDVIRLLKPFG